MTGCCLHLDAGEIMSWIDLLKTVPLYVAALAAVVWLTVLETDINESPIVRLQQVSIKKRNPFSLLRLRFHRAHFEEC
jgi:hypothetical protein